MIAESVEALVLFALSKIDSCDALVRNASKNDMIELLQFEGNRIEKGSVADVFNFLGKKKKKKGKRQKRTHFALTLKTQALQETKKIIRIWDFGRTSRLWAKSTESVSCLCLRSSIIYTHEDKLTSYKN